MAVLRSIYMSEEKTPEADVFSIIRISIIGYCAASFDPIVLILSVKRESSKGSISFEV